MKTLVIPTQGSEVAFILNKLTNTIKAYTEIYPELMYITSGIALVKKQTGPADDINLLAGFNKYLKEKLFEYHVIKILQHKFQQDIALIENGQEISREKDLYLEFTYYKEMAPIK